MSGNPTILHLGTRPIFNSGIAHLIKRYFPDYRLIHRNTVSAFEEEICIYNPKIIIIENHVFEYFKDFDFKHFLIRQVDQCILIVVSTDSHEAESYSRGASGLIHENDDEEVWIEAINQLLNNQKYFSKLVLQWLLEQKLKPQWAPSGKKLLTYRETEVLQLVAKGNPSTAIADALGISLHTVQTHRKNIMKKTGVNSASGLVLFAIETGMVSLTQNKPGR